MRSNLRLLVLLLVLAIAAHVAFREAAEPATVRELRAREPAVSAAPDGKPRLGPCDVTHVTDGDTLRVRCGSRAERVRLLQTDTAEHSQPGYQEARDALTKLIAGSPVELEIGPDPRDDYGRLLAYVFVGGQNLNLAMIRDGWSPYYVRYGAGAYPIEFAQAERRARERGLGIWARRAATQPAAVRGELDE